MACLCLRNFYHKYQIVIAPYFLFALLLKKMLIVNIYCFCYRPSSLIFGNSPWMILKILSLWSLSLAPPSPPAPPPPLCQLHLLLALYFLSWLSSTTGHCPQPVTRETYTDLIERKDTCYIRLKQLANHTLLYWSRKSYNRQQEAVMKAIWEYRRLSMKCPTLCVDTVWLARQQVSWEGS